MPDYKNTIGVMVPEVLLPKEGIDLQKWAVVACDQYTSQPAYWERVAEHVGELPSTLHLVLPEVFLGSEGEMDKIQQIHASMQNYIENGLLQKQQPGFVWIRRQVGDKTRTGLLMALDLEHYDYHKGAQTLIRASEGTIESRIPPRLRIRENAKIELPHIMILIDDPQCTVIEPLANQKDEMQPLYDFELMENGGHIEGYLVKDAEMIQHVIHQLEELYHQSALQSHGEMDAPLLFALGDGNHSFATAKAAWEKIKIGLTAEEFEVHPARYALVEVVNVHDEGIEFEPIHRTVFHVDDTSAFLKNLQVYLEKYNNGAIQHIKYDNVKQAQNALQNLGDSTAHVLPYFAANCYGAFVLQCPNQQLAVGSLQAALDDMLKEAAFSQIELDYIHGEDVVLDLAQQTATIGFLLPVMKKSELFPTVRLDGALPRKTFSMGEADEKRYYLECREITFGGE